MFARLASRIKLKTLLPAACCAGFIIQAMRDYQIKIDSASFDVECATLTFLIYWHIEDSYE